MAISVKCPLIQGVKLVKHISNDSAESKINPYLSGSSFISLDLMVPSSDVVGLSPFYSTNSPDRKVLLHYNVINL